MNMKSFFIMLFISSTNAFIPNVKPVVKSFVYEGDLPPVGYFDPMVLTSKNSDAVIKYVREAELQHGRVAMMSFIALAGLDILRDDLAIDARPSVVARTKISACHRGVDTDFHKAPRIARPPGDRARDGVSRPPSPHPPP